MPEPGKVVRSTAGRDKGSLMVVIHSEPDAVYVCDGKRRPLGRPKRKNPGHVEELDTSLLPQEAATDKALRRALAALRGSD